MCSYRQTNNTGEDGRGGSRSGSECVVTERQTVQVRMAEEGPEAEQNVSLHSSLSAAVRGGTGRYNEQREIPSTSWPASGRNPKQARSYMSLGCITIIPFSFYHFILLPFDPHILVTYFIFYSAFLLSLYL